MTFQRDDFKWRDPQEVRRRSNTATRGVGCPCAKDARAFGLAVAVLDECPAEPLARCTARPLAENCCNLMSHGYI